MTNKLIAIICAAVFSAAGSVAWAGKTASPGPITDPVASILAIPAVRNAIENSRAAFANISDLGGKVTASQAIAAARNLGATTTATGGATMQVVVSSDVAAGTQTVADITIEPDGTIVIRNVRTVRPG